MADHDHSNCPPGAHQHPPAGMVMGPNGPVPVGPGGPMPGMPGPGGPGVMQINADPALQELLDSLPHTPRPFALVSTPVPGTQPPQVQEMVVCAEHKTPTCETCSVNFTPLNYMQQFMRNAPPGAIPPPVQMAPPPERAASIKAAKEAGNTAFKANNLPVAIQSYSRSADMALSRPPWEQASLSREEVSIALCNRSAAFAAVGAFVNALADAEAVVALKRPWTKGHFRRARALVGLNRLEEARDAVVDGLQFEPDDKELNAFLDEIDNKILQQEQGLGVSAPASVAAETPIVAVS